jgi:hypothetical protein
VGLEILFADLWFVVRRSLSFSKGLMMAYLEPAEYPSYGLPVGTTTDWVTTATALINSYCRRPDLNIVQYTERLRVVSGARTVMLSYLPLSPIEPATSPLVSLRGRCVNPRRGEIANEMLMDAARVFGVPGQWVEIDAALADVDVNTGELTLPGNFFGLAYDEIEVAYTAGLLNIGDDVKSACAQIVRNAQATPALNASQAKMDTMWIKYFSSSLIDETVKAWLRPYVANRLG